MNFMAPLHLLNIYNSSNNINYECNLRNNKMQLIYTRTGSVDLDMIRNDFRLFV